MGRKQTPPGALPSPSCTNRTGGERACPLRSLALSWQLAAAAPRFPLSIEFLPFVQVEGRSEGRARQASQNKRGRWLGQRRPELYSFALASPLHPVHPTRLADT